MDLLNDKDFFNKATEMLHEAGQKKHGQHSTIHARWLRDERYRKSLSDKGWKESDIMLFDRIALENHTYTATRAEFVTQNIGF